MGLKLKKTAVEEYNNQHNQQPKMYTVLVVDDELSNIRAVSAALEADYNVLSASNGREALELINRLEDPTTIQLIISDQRMPEMSGVEFFARILKIIPYCIRIILTGHTDAEEIIEAINSGHIYRYMTKPVEATDLQLTVQRGIERYVLGHQNRVLIEDLKRTNRSLQEALHNLQVSKISTGVYWLQVPEADLYVLCGCPADVVKHMKQKGYIAETDRGESGPNAILLSESLIQRGEFANLAEFPVLQMLYLQGMMVPNHPNNKGDKPILIGDNAQLKAQLEYIYRGNYGLTSLQEIIDAGVEETQAQVMMRIKMQFAFGKIESADTLVSCCPVAKDEAFTEIRSGVFVRRVSYNVYEFEYKGRTAQVDLNLSENESYESPYQLGSHAITREYFSVLHSGEGDGWDVNRPAMASIIMHQGDIYLIDAGPSILNVLLAVGIDVSEVKGIFHTHCHDDHFAGLPALMQADHRLKYYATPVVRASVTKKLSALMSIPESAFARFFDVQDLVFDEWNDVNGLEVKPLYSPHPVDTNMFLFRALGGQGYKTYGHWADLTAFNVLDGMVQTDQSKPGISPELNEFIKQQYLTPVDLKKIDIGGGMIHGVVEDYANDASAKVVLAHTAKSLTPDQKEVGSNAAFAAVDVLIPRTQDYLREKASGYLARYFPEASMPQILALLNSDIVSYNPGEAIIQKGQISTDVFLLLSGTVERISGGRSSNISTGSFIGEEIFFDPAPSTITYRSMSHIEVFKFPHDLSATFLHNNGVTEFIARLQDSMVKLRQSWLFREGFTTFVHNRIARYIETIVIAEGETKTLDLGAGLYMIDSGVFQIEGQVTEYRSGDFFGEESLWGEAVKSYQVIGLDDPAMFFIPSHVIDDVPMVLWKLLEHRTD